MALGRRWTHDELFVVLNLYHKLPFGQLHYRNPVIRDLSGKIGRTPSSVAMKLCNFASLDPALKLRGIKGLQGASRSDLTVWNEFQANLEDAVPASEIALRKLFSADECAEVEVLPKVGVKIIKATVPSTTEAIGNAKFRRGQEYFRNAVLNNFGGKCGVTGLHLRPLLIASHILPWHSHPAERLNVRNGVCLSRLYDAAFDCGLISFDNELRLLLSPQLVSQLGHRAVSESFGAYAGQHLQLAEDTIPPEPSFLALHRNKIFLSS
jgi:putative restriction endonuclease